jgi:hypothetical protein
LRRCFYIILHRQKYLSAGIQSWIDLCGLEAEVNSNRSGATDQGNAD